MTTKFRTGDTVRSAVDAQGLKRDATYEVVGVDVNPFGCVAYAVSPTGRTGDAFWVRNGHLLLELVESGPDADCTRCYKPVAAADAVEAFGALYHRRCAPKSRRAS